ncbi:MAG: NAD(P)H-dependent oxidoreductase [Actinomycetota bacterium]|nr:NAD(P)H-dependent oxidoreductase [Actinomycetota bacterium]
MRLLALSGSLRADSYNSRLLRIAAEEAPSGVEIEIYDDLRAIPPYDSDEDIGTGPEPVRRLRELIASADGLIFATPEYNASIPGVLKNAVDWASRPRAQTSLAGKPAAILGASTGQFGGVWAQAELRKVLGSAGARVVEAELAVPGADSAFDEAGAIRDDALLKALRALIANVVREADRDREPALAA